MRALTCLAVAALVLLAIAPVAGQSADGFEYEELGRIRHESLGDDVVRSGRIVLQPGATLPMSEFSGEWTVQVESGILAVEGSFGRLQVNDSIADAIVASDDSTLWVRPRSQLGFDDGITMRWSNPGDEPTVLMTMSIIDEEDEPILTLDEAETRRQELRVEPFEHPVVKRIVLRKPGSRVCDHEITIRDRSGRLIDARVPDPVELRFVERDPGPTGVALGPIAGWGKGHGLLVTWLGSDCGPTARIDIGEDVSAVRIETLCHCDGAGGDHSVILQLEGWTDIDDVEAFQQGWDR
jgi:hypothetical protein